MREWLLKLLGPSKKEIRMAEALRRLRKAVESDCKATGCGAAGSDCNACVHDARMVLIDNALKGAHNG